jgi:hypothetical protein
MILEVKKAQFTYYLLYIYRWDKHTPRNTHVTYRAVRTSASASKWRTDPNIESSVLIPNRILHIFSREPELMMILDYQPMEEPIGERGTVLQIFRTKPKVFKYLGDRSARSELMIPIDKPSTILI